MKTKNKEQIIDKAREFLDTPYLHQGRVKGGGIDCCGLVIQVAKELGLSDYDLTGYSRYADGVDFLKEFFEQCKPKNDYEPGDILVFSIRRRPQHCGIVAEFNGNLSLIHAYQSIGRCVEHNLDKAWSDRILQVFEFPNVYWRKAWPWLRLRHGGDDYHQDDDYRARQWHRAENNWLESTPANFRRGSVQHD